MMCHMMADTTAELLDMANRIGVQAKWIQEAGTYREHFDICKNKRVTALKLGAIETDHMGIFSVMVRKKESPERSQS